MQPGDLVEDAYQRAYIFLGREILEEGHWAWLGHEADASRMGCFVFMSVPDSHRRWSYNCDGSASFLVSREVMNEYAQCFECG